MVIATSTAILIAAATTVAATGYSINEQKKAAKAQGRAAEVQQKQQEVQYQASQRRAMRETQIRRTKGQATSQAAGVVGSSLYGGGFSSLSSQLGGTLGYGSQMSGLSQLITGFNAQAQQYASNASIGGDIAGLGANVFNALGGSGYLQTGKTD
jgi:Flp pilus assembly protein TadB